MKKVVLFLFIFKMMFAVDFLVKLDATNKPSEDDVNTYIYTKHFRLIISKDGYSQYESDVNNIKQVMDDVYKYEIIDYGFKKPIGSDKYYIDVYLVDGKTKNLETDSTCEGAMSSHSVGEAKEYSTGEFYMKIYLENLSGNSTSYVNGVLAHEFFHGVHFAYHFAQNAIQNGSWNESKNYWFGESTPTFIGNDLYGNNFDKNTIVQNAIASSKYMSYSSFVASYLYDGLEYNSDTSSEIYNKDVFWIFILDKYGQDKAINFIKHILEAFYQKHPTAKNSDDEGDDEILKYVEKQSLKDFNKSLSVLVKEFAVWLKNKGFYVLKNSDKNLKKYGIAFLEKYKTYSLVTTDTYLAVSYNGEENTTSKKIILINTSNNDLSPEVINNNVFDITLHKGWNFVGNIYDDNISMKNINGVILWVYRDNKWLGYSKYINIKKALDEKNLSVTNTKIKPGEAFFIYSDKDVKFVLNSKTNKLYKNTTSILRTVRFDKDWNSSADVYIYNDGDWQLNPQTVSVGYGIYIKKGD